MHSRVSFGFLQLNTLKQPVSFTIKAILTSIFFVVCTSCAVSLENGKIDEPSSSAIKQSYDLNGRNVDVWSWMPEKGSKPKGTIIFSHGFGSNPLEYDGLILPWLEAGYRVYAAMHVDSRLHADTEKYQGMSTLYARLEDAKFLSDTFGHEGYIAAGHSYGAYLSLVMGGVNAQKADGSVGSYKDDRAKLALAFSPPGALPGLISKSGFTSLAVPALIQTGTLDVPLGGEWQSHLDAFYGAPESGERYALIFEGVNHYFGGAICRSDVPGPPQYDDLKIASKISIDFIEAYFDEKDLSMQKLENRLSDSGQVRFLRR